MPPFVRTAFVSFFLIVSVGLIRKRNPNLNYKSDELKRRAPVVGFETGLGLVLPEPRTAFEDEDGNPLPRSDLCDANDLCDPKTEWIHFKAMLPQSIRKGDKIRLKGTVYASAQQFSINLVNENQQYITYHFQLDIMDELIVESSKNGGMWSRQTKKPYRGFEGDGFDLEFTFLEKSVSVYKRRGSSSKFITKFVPRLDLKRVESVRVWGDVEKVTDFMLSYA